MKCCKGLASHNLFISSTFFQLYRTTNKGNKKETIPNSDDFQISDRLPDQYFKFFCDHINYFSNLPQPSSVKQLSSKEFDIANILICFAFQSDVNFQYQQTETGNRQRPIALNIQ